jgi:hypothetical protein
MITLPGQKKYDGGESNDQRQASMRAVLNLNLDLSEDILVRAAKVAFETLDELGGVGLEPCNIIYSQAFSTLVEQYVQILSSGK